MSAAATNIVLGPELKKLERSLKGSFGNLLKIDVKSNLPDVPTVPIDVNGDFEIRSFRCCNETVKIEPHEKVFCVICGQEVDLKMSDSKKVFLSHKGVDKEFVIDFKDTRLLGQFVSERGKILPRRLTGTCSPHQHVLTAAIKRARNIALLPFALES